MCFFYIENLTFVLFQRIIMEVSWKSLGSILDQTHTLTHRKLCRVSNYKFAQIMHISILRYLKGDVLMNLKVIEGLKRFPVSETRWHFGPFGILTAS